MKTKKQIKCPKCKARYWLKREFKQHMKKKHPFSRHISYFELLDRPTQWGCEYKVEKEAREFQKSPHDFALQIAFLSHIWDTLQRILEELRRVKTIR